MRSLKCPSPTDPFLRTNDQLRFWAAQGGANETTAPCAHQTARVDVQRTEIATGGRRSWWPIALPNDLGGKLPYGPGSRLTASAVMKPGRRATS